MAIFLKGTQNGQFWPKCKLVWMDAEFILVSIDTTITMKQQELAE